MSPARITFSCSTFPVVALTAVARQPGKYASLRSSALGAFNVTLTQESPHSAVRILVTDPEEGATSQARGSNEVALKTEKVSSVEVSFHFDVATAS